MLSSLILGSVYLLAHLVQFALSISNYYNALNGQHLNHFIIAYSILITTWTTSIVNHSMLSWSCRQLRRGYCAMWRILNNYMQNGVYIPTTSVKKKKKKQSGRNRPMRRIMHIIVNHSMLSWSCWQLRRGYCAMRQILNNYMQNGVYIPTTLEKKKNRAEAIA